VRETASVPRRIEIGYDRPIDKMGDHIVKIISNMASEGEEDLHCGAIDSSAKPQGKGNTTFCDHVERRSSLKFRSVHRFSELNECKSSIVTGPGRDVVGKERIC
jgi:hypothetical protein